MSNASFDYAAWTSASFSSASSSATASSSMHPASLVNPASHSSAMIQLIDMDISQSFIEYLAECISETVQYALTRDAPRGRNHARTLHARKFTAFVEMVLRRAEVQPAAALVALVYVVRARPHLSIALEEWALERVFLGALIVASKYTQDSTLKNVHWGLVSGVFGPRDIGRIEREFLEVLDWQLGVREDEILAHWDGIMGVGGARLRQLGSEEGRRHVRVTQFLHPHLRAPRDPLPLQMPDLAASPTSTCVSLSPRTPLHSGTGAHARSLPHSPSASKPENAMDVDSPPLPLKLRRFFPTTAQPRPIMVS
ncbi:unnamed protein product [Mycena citricolor]|uniref:Cyclin N-terminal domain-containing protein n=1 Tax=Mycena citricolor TaxID=2018698 RepID=A0AAD2HLH6_9AGAR|nr:unnamed protein product [Mycena citricolor]